MTTRSGSSSSVGIGDELLVTGQAKRAQQSDPRKVRVVGFNGATRWDRVWDGNPRFAKPDECGDFQILRNGPHCRPYIAAKESLRWLWKRYDPEPGEIYFTAEELDFASRHRPEIVIEPTIKRGASPNKQWPHWQELVDMGGSFTQLGPAGTRTLRGVRFIEAQDFRQAAAVLARASLYIGPDGGMHHAAAALGVPAIVIRGAFISHECTGYTSHRNLFTGRGLGCGMRVLCQCCVDAMRKITPRMVANEIKLA